ncbi:hypothetical protein LBMAG38_25790 [Chloroflexota bacterium]|nr:hypothetical protein LBMAG38_25790 [Chloroflexota bacterium]
MRVAMPNDVAHATRIKRALELQLMRGEALRPGVTIETVPIPDGPNSWTADDTARTSALERVLASGTPIDVIWTPHIDIADLHLDGRLRTLDDLVKRDRVDLKAFMPQALRSGISPDIGLLALPEEIAGRQLYFRTDHFSEAGLDYRRTGFDFERPAITWEALRRTAISLEGAPAARSRVPFDPGHESLAGIVLAWQSGAPDATVPIPTELPRQETLKRASTEAFSWIASVSRELGLQLPYRNISWPSVSRTGISSSVQGLAGILPDDMSRHPFISGKASICIESSRFVSSILSHHDGLPFRVVETPRRADASSVIGWADVWGYSMLRGGSDDGWDLLNYLTGEDAAYASARGVASLLPVVSHPGSRSRKPSDLPGGPRTWFPPFSGRLALDRFMTQNYRSGIKIIDEANDHALEQLRHARVWPFQAGSRRWLGAIETVRRAVVRDGMDPRTAIDQARTLFFAG